MEDSLGANLPQGFASGGEFPGRRSRGISPLCSHLGGWRGDKFLDENHSQPVTTMIKLAPKKIFTDFQATLHVICTCCMLNQQGTYQILVCILILVHLTRRKLDLSS